MDAATLDALYRRITASSGKPAPDAEIPAIVFDSQESEDRFLELIAQDPPPATRSSTSRYHFVAGRWVQSTIPITE